MWKWLLNIFKKNRPACVYPLPVLNGREPLVSSSSKWVNKSRPTHNGDDWMYRRVDTDTDPVGDGEGTRNKRWIVPEGTPCLAVRDGIVHETHGKIKTGYRLYIQHNDGYRSGYFHLSELLVQPGDFVRAGDAIGIVGDNPVAVDPRHLHFEVSEGVRYKPIDPMRYLEAHGAVPWQP